MRPNANTAVTGLAVLAIGLGAAGCGGGDDETTSSKPASPPPKEATTGGGATLQLAADPSGKIAYDKKALSAKAGKSTLQFENASQVPHAVELEGNGVEKETKTIQGGKASLALNLKPGTYEFYCPVDSHKQQGMKGVLTVK